MGREESNQLRFGNEGPIYGGKKDVFGYGPGGDRLKHVRLLRKPKSKEKIYYSREGAKISNGHMLYEIVPVGTSKKGLARNIRSAMGKRVYNLNKVKETNRSTGQKREGYMVIKDSIIEILRTERHALHEKSVIEFIANMSLDDIRNAIIKYGPEASRKLWNKQLDDFNGYYGELTGGILHIGRTYNPTHARIIDEGILRRLLERKSQQGPVRQEQDDGYDR